MMVIQIVRFGEYALGFSIADGTPLFNGGGDPMKFHRTRHKGFTLIELMLVSTILGLLAAIAIPKFASLILKAKQAELKARLGCIRSAISIYYADNEGRFPEQTHDTNPLVAPASGDWLYCLHDKYLGKIRLWTGFPVIPHEESAKFAELNVPVPIFDDLNITNWVWLYNSNSGVIYINCTHSDFMGRIWSSM